MCLPSPLKRLDVNFDSGPSSVMVMGFCPSFHCTVNLGRTCKTRLDLFEHHKWTRFLKFSAQKVLQRKCCSKGQLSEESYERTFVFFLQRRGLRYRGHQLCVQRHSTQGLKALDTHCGARLYLHTSLLRKAQPPQSSV